MENKQIPQEVFEIFAALYYKQRVLGCYGFAKYGDDSKVTRIKDILMLDADDYLLLKSLSDISDEDAIGVSNICKVSFPKGGAGGMNDRVSNIKQWAHIYAMGSSEISDFLRSRGYLLPFLGYSCEDWINSGRVKIKK